MQVGPYTLADEAHIQLELLARGVADLTAAGVLATPEGARVTQELADLFVGHGAGIQGNLMTLAQVRAVLHDHAVLEGPSRHAQREVVNLARGLDYTQMLAADDLPLTERLIRIMHALVMRGLLPPDVEPGTYRSQDLPDLAYGPPQAHAVTSEMGTFARWLGLKPDAPDYLPNPLVRAVLAHTWLLVVHPFLNGNGRTARLLLNLVLLRAQYPLCIIRTEDGPRYMAALRAAGIERDLTPMMLLAAERVGDSLAAYWV